MTKRDDETKEGFCKIPWRKLRLRGSLLIVLIQFFYGGRGNEEGWGWALIRGWALINFFCLWDGRLFEVGANLRLGAFSNKYGISRASDVVRRGSPVDFSENGICVIWNQEFGILKQNGSEVWGWNYVWDAEYRKYPLGDNERKFGWW